MPRPERILVLRSGRHLQVALAALRAWTPECDVAVVGTPGSETAIAQAGVAPADTFLYSKRSRFTPAAFFFSSTALAVRYWRFDRLAVLWNDPEGVGQGNVDRTAFVLAPRGFLAVTPDGRIVERTVFLQIKHEALRTAASIATALVLGALYLPALLLPKRWS